MHFRVIPNNRQNPPSPNERLSKGYRFADIKASAHASHKTHACISLKQRSYSRNYGLVCNLGKQMAVLVDLRDKVLVGLNFVEKNQRSSIKTMMFSQDNFEMLKPMLFVVFQWEFFQMLRNLHSCQLISYTKLNQCNLCKF